VLRYCAGGGVDLEIVGRLSGGDQGASGSVCGCCSQIGGLPLCDVSASVELLVLFNAVEMTECSSVRQPLIEEVGALERDPGELRHRHAVGDGEVVLRGRNCV